MPTFNDNRREFIGGDAIRSWLAYEVVGVKVRIEVREVLDHYGDTVVRVAYDGEFGPDRSARRYSYDKLLHRA